MSLLINDSLIIIIIIFCEMLIDSKLVFTTSLNEMNYVCRYIKKYNDVC